MFSLTAHRIAFTLAVLTMCVTTATAQRSTWTDKTGKFSVEAEFVETKEGSVLLKKMSSSLITAPLTRLSETDQRYLQSLAEGESKKETEQAVQSPTEPKSELRQASDHSNNVAEVSGQQQDRLKEQKGSELSADDRRRLAAAKELYNKGGALYGEGKYEEVRKLVEQQLVILRKVLGEEYSETATSLNNLGTLLTASGDYGLAI